MLSAEWKVRVGALSGAFFSFFQKKRPECKIILAKGSPIVYKCSIHLTFLTMKNVLLSMLAAVSCGSLTVSALDAKDARVTFEPDAVTSQTVKVEALSAPGGSGFIPTKPLLKNSAVPWQVVNIPVTVEAVGPKNEKGKEEKPQFISSIDFHIYLAFRTDADGKDSKPLLLDKEITYVNIPVHPGNAVKDYAQNKMYVGVFISPSDALKIKTTGKDKGILDGSLMAVAVEASYNGANCMNTEEKKRERSKILNPADKKEFNGAWWKKKGKTNGVELLSIAETPYAPYYAPFYPAVKPMFGPAHQVPAGVSALGNVAPGPVAPSSSSAAGDTSGGGAADDASSDGEVETPITPSRDSKSRSRGRTGRSSRRDSLSF